MSMLTVATHFESIGELAEGLSDRVAEGRFVLYGPDLYEEGDSIGFEVQIADGSTVLEGRGIVVECTDGGEERDPSVRYDVTLAGLDLQGASEMVWESMLEAAGIVTDDVAAPADEGGFEAEATAVADLEALAAEPEPEPEPEPVAAEPEPVAAEPEPEPEPVAAAPEPEPEPVAAAPEPEPEPEPEPYRYSSPDSFDDEPASSDEAPQNVQLVELKGAEPPSAPSDPGGFSVALDLADNRLARPTREHVFHVEAPEREPSEPSTGHFEYGGPISIPARPPRPAIDASQRVARAPALTTEEAYRAAREAQGFHAPAPGQVGRSIPPPAFGHPNTMPSVPPAAPVPAVDDLDLDADQAFDDSFDLDSGEA